MPQFVPLPTIQFHVRKTTLPCCGPLGINPAWITFTSCAPGGGAGTPQLNGGYQRPSGKVCAARRSPAAVDPTNPIQPARLPTLIHRSIGHRLLAIRRELPSPSEELYA